MGREWLGGRGIAAGVAAEDLEHRAAVAECGESGDDVGVLAVTLEIGEEDVVPNAPTARHIRACLFSTMSC